MASYLITGVSRGLGFEFLRQLSSNPANTIVGLVRDKAATEKKVASELESRQNIHILQGDMTDYASLKKAVDDTAEITGGALDYVIANAALLMGWSANYPIGVLGKEPQKLEQTLLATFHANVVGNVHLFNLTIPLVLRGRAKKVIAITSGLSDVELIAQYELSNSSPYCISKSALNMAVASFSAQYARDGVLFMGVAPGLVNTGQFNDMTEEQKQMQGQMMAKFKSYAPDFTGPTTAEVSVGQMLSVIEGASVEAGNGGAFVSQFGNKKWL